MTTRTFAVIAVVGVLFSGCSTKGELSGDIFVTMKSGDIKRGADVTIILVPSTGEFETAWKTQVEEFRKDYAAASAADRDAEAQYQEATRQSTEARDRARQRFEANLRAGNYRVPGSWNDPEYQLARERESRLSAAREYRADSTVRRHQKQALALLGKQAIHAARTDVNGHYEIKEVPPGKYYVWATYEILDNELFWMVPTDVKGGPIKVDLSNRNAGWAIVAPPS